MTPSLAIKGAGGAFQVFGLFCAIHPGYAGLFDGDGECFGGKSARGGAVFQAKIVGFYNEKVGSGGFFEARNGLLAVPDGLGWAIFKLVGFAILETDQAIGEDGKPDIFFGDNSLGWAMGWKVGTGGRGMGISRWGNL